MPNVPKPILTTLCRSAEKAASLKACLSKTQNIGQEVIGTPAKATKKLPALRAAFLLLLLAAVCTAPAFAQKNILLLIADDLGTDYLGFYGDGLDTAEMPNIRSLLADGVRFRQAWSFPYCSEIRAAVLTGRYPFPTRSICLKVQVARGIGSRKIVVQ